MVWLEQAQFCPAAKGFAKPALYNCPVFCQHRQKLAQVRSALCHKLEQLGGMVQFKMAQLEIGSGKCKHATV
jgi:hypothetical protein